MAREIRSFAVTVQPKTQPAAPAKVALAMPPRIARAVRVRVPPGPAGNVGFALANSGEKVIPWGGQDWLIADDEVMSWVLEAYPTSGAWELWAYNTGAFPHTIYLTFELDPVTAAAGERVLTPVEV